jgi:hypothetical protein
VSRIERLLVDMLARAGADVTVTVRHRRTAA